MRGTSGDGFTVFRGIPYAAPLRGPRRFQAPAPVTPWDGVRDASAAGPSVPQPYPQLWTPGDDPDCLTINVWTPEAGGDGLPVLVWLHGGGFLSGSAATPDFDGAAYARDGVVLVTLNYRVGYEGFGWIEDAPCNRGVLDQIAALRWVRDNIAAFGGDPGRVTLFGQSAGASSIATMVAGRGAEGLFRRGIVQSPGNVFVPAGEARTISAMITDELGVKPTAEALADVPSEAIHAIQMNPVAVMSADPAAWTQSNCPYAIVLDGELLDLPPWTAMRRDGTGRSTDLICGFTTDEAAMFTAGLDLSGADPAAAACGMGLDPAAVDDYRRAHPGITANGLHTMMLSDALFRMPALWCAQAHADAGGRTYLYEFAWRSPARDGALGACHGLDVPFAFGTPDGPLAADLIGRPVPAGFDALSIGMRTAWASFAATGDPGWPRFDPGEGLARIWETPPAVRADPLAASREIWDHHHR